MKAVIKDVQFKKDVQTRVGTTMYQFLVVYDDKHATYLAANKDQKYFVKGKEAEFTEEQNGKYLNVKPVRKFNRHIQKEQSRYSAFAVSYCKDLIVAGKLEFAQWEPASKKIFHFMVELDKSIND